MTGASVPSRKKEKKTPVVSHWMFSRKGKVMRYIQ